MLVQKSSRVPPGRYEFQPWFYEQLKGDIQLRQFRIIKCLGSGGFSLVYLAQDKLKGNIHALKLIDKAFILDS
jgi:serine/threonine protein kinase